VSLSHEDLCVANSVDDGDGCDISSLLEILGCVTDRRSRRGRVYGFVFILAASLIAVLGGASNFRQIADQVADFPQSLLRKLGAKWCYFRGGFRRPSEKTIRLVLTNIDADQLDAVAGAWLRHRAKPETDGTMTVAIDGKVLRGAWTDDNEKFTLFSAMLHRIGVTIAQVQVPADTNEITQVKALLDTIPARTGERVVVTMDAAHTQRDTAEYLVAERGFTYIMTTKGNQPTLLKSVFTACLPLVKTEPHHTVEERGHGRINRWSTWITDATGIDFPHVRTAGCIRRETFNLAGDRTSKEYAWIITGSPTGEGGITHAEHLHKLVREHWGIENKSHYVRDTTWREDAHQAYSGSGPQTMATLRNIAAGLIRLTGVSAIKRTTEWLSRNPIRALTFIATHRNDDHLT
jgi:predicted transposase YbfD/YdcC